MSTELNRISIEQLRAEFPITDERAYLITGAIAPAARSIVARTQEWIERWTRVPLDNFEAWSSEVDGLRSALARLIGADASEVAITDGTSRAANMAIDILARQGASRVVVDPTTYPSSLLPWLSKTDKKLTISDTELSATDWPLSERLVATCISHVAWQTGYRHDLAALSERTHAYEGLLMVDVAQSAGCVPIDVRRDGIDLLGWNDHEVAARPSGDWLSLRPRRSAGGLRASRRELRRGRCRRERLAPVRAAGCAEDAAGGTSS